MLNKVFAALLHCAPSMIPVEFKDAAETLATKFVKTYSLSGNLKMDIEIVRNRVYSLINACRSVNPNFTVAKFNQCINENTLFYSTTDIQTLIGLFQQDCNAATPFALCFFARKLYSFKRNRKVYTRGLEDDDIDSTLMEALLTVLSSFQPGSHFSFSYLDKRLFEYLTTLAGEMRPFKFNRNELVYYTKFSYMIEKYSLDADNLDCFMREAHDAGKHDSKLSSHLFSIEESDIISCKSITAPKAFDFYYIYCLENMGILGSVISTEDDTGTFTSTEYSKVDTGYSSVELTLAISQLNLTETELRIVNRLMMPKGYVFSNKELKEDFGISRYRVNQLKARLLDELF